LAWYFLCDGKTIKVIKKSETINVNEPSTQISSLSNKLKQLEGINHIIAHNLRGPAANIKMLAELLEGKKIPEVEKDDDFTIGEALQYINDSTSSLINTLDTLIEAADIQLNETIKAENCNVQDIVRSIIDQLHGFIQQKKATVALMLEITRINYPKAYLQSILYNFINNALKYSKPDTQLEITISTYVQNGRTVLTVKDNGLGIDLEAYGSRMFKLNQVFHSGYESKGIGLYITKTQIESLGGTISVKSEVNKGSEFIVVF
jgi:signal transduction histidine kinase